MRYERADGRPLHTPELDAQDNKMHAEVAAVLAGEISSPRLVAIIRQAKSAVVDYFAQGPRHPELEGQTVNHGGFRAGR